MMLRSDRKDQGAHGGDRVAVQAATGTLESRDLFNGLFRMGERKARKYRDSD